MSFRIAIVGEGPTDQMLRWPTEWIISDSLSAYQFIDVSSPDVCANGRDTQSRVITACSLYEPDLIIVHRDSDNAGYEEREAECSLAANHLENVVAVVCVPVRMTEAWFLFDEDAIRVAAGNPAGTSNLGLPSVTEAERMANPKAALNRALKLAAGVKGRRKDKFNKTISQHSRRVAELIMDYSPLRGSVSFNRFESSLATAIESMV